MPIAPQIQQGELTVTLTALTQVGRQDVTRTMLVEVSTKNTQGGRPRGQPRSLILVDLGKVMV